MFISIMQVSASGYAQTITFKSQNATLKTLFKAIKKQTGYNVVWDSETINLTEPIVADFSETSIPEVLKTVLTKQSLSYVIEKKTVVIRYVPPVEKLSPQLADIKIDGQVVDQNGAPLIGGTITIKGSTRKIAVGAGGYFTIDKVDAGATLIFTYLGYETQEVKLKPGVSTLKITMKLTENKMDDVVITGTGINRKKDSFTGSAVTFTGDQLKSIGNKNVLQSLKTLDPSFIQIENNLQGSNPNRIPSFEVRGKTSINTSNLNDQFGSDPNQPLFILNGFESSLQTIYDLDMNRVASITILKDAASTALYGSKAANGVVVVETKRPQPGELRVNYTGDFSVDMPDLSSYNMMNASEKLQFEKLADVYADPTTAYWATEANYNAKLADIQRGVNTYWLSEPVRTGFSNRHSLTFSGGSNELSFDANINYRNQDGVMKGSNRETYGGNIDLNYRKGKLNLTNMFSLNGFRSNESPYGSFSDFVNANPYYRKTNQDGSLSKYLDPLNITPSTANPLYNASLFSINQSQSLSYINNLQAIYTLSDSFRIQGGIQIKGNNDNSIIFTNPENTMFDGVTAYEKGRYTNTHPSGFSYNGNLMFTYAKVIDKHQINANIRGDIQQNSNRSTGFSAVGFPYGTNGNPAFANSYTPYSRPSSAISIYRGSGVLASVNYAYDQKYLLDATYRLDGSSAFGSNNIFQSFASAGLGWNIHREPFILPIHWISLLKLRADVGVTGNQNLGQFSSTSIYSFLPGSNSFGQGLDLISLGNPNLEWQKTVQASYGLDFALLNNRFSGYLEYFDKYTDPLVISANGTLPSSTGASSNYVINAGNLTTRGWNFNLRMSPIYNLKDRVIWTVGITGTLMNSKYGGLNSKLDALNKQQETTSGLIRYSDGYSPDDIWAVVSRGIDPANGNEIYQKKDGSLTYVYSTDDIIKVGNTRPKMEGVISTSFTYKGFTAGANIRYLIDGYVFNSAVYNKVENISTTGVLYNQDKRALYERWQKPGDVTQFKAINTRVFTPMSSRFIQKDTHFVGESFNLGWRINKTPWLQALKMQSLSINLYVNDIFRLESVVSERGTDYPFSRSASLSLNASF
ncbi:SusC/RagA family TonB-linked outer membrane protein [Pedobacter sp. R-06]|uniref:SusC/RagA family TonB-linked outer membrane protein n=1 Tax=Pedobacter sp. R-06 TaxID=3404051 RepID=UPI003CF283B0